MPPKYQWQQNSLARPYGDATAVFEHLEHLRSKDDLTPEIILTDAEKRSSPLHTHFEWNQREAAERYRRRQIADLMGKLVRTEGRRTRRVYMNVKGTPTAPRQYDLVSRVLKNPELRKPYARRALLEMRNWELRYGDFPELRGALSAMRQVLRTVVRPSLKKMEEAEVA